MAYIAVPVVPATVLSTSMPQISSPSPGFFGFAPVPSKKRIIADFAKNKLAIGTCVTQHNGSDSYGFIVSEFCGLGAKNRDKRVRLRRYDSAKGIALEGGKTITLMWYRGTWYDELRYKQGVKHKGRIEKKAAEFQFTRGAAMNCIDPSF